jgi:hypothetical protein
MSPQDDLENKGADGKDRLLGSITVLTDLFFIVFLFTSTTIYSFLLISFWLSRQDLYESAGGLFLCYSPICGVILTIIASLFFRELISQGRKQKILALSVITATGLNSLLLIIGYWVAWKVLHEPFDFYNPWVYIIGLVVGIASLVFGWTVYHNLNRGF